jgi:hypothetical protein
MAKTAAAASALWLSLSGLIGLLSCGHCPAQAQQFSADIVGTRGNGATALSGKVYVLNGKVRIETADFPNEFFLIDGGTGAAYFVRPVQKIFMDARQSTPLTRMLIAVDPDNPCQQWQDAAKRASTAMPDESWRCERINQEEVEGHATTAWRVVSPSGRTMLGWINSELKFPLKVRSEGGFGITVKNIRQESQAEKLFEIPLEFQRFDPEALINRIKQSDVWVSDP